MSDKRGRNSQRQGNEEGSRAGARSKRSTKRAKVMEESNQTVEERRRLRLEQRNLKNKVIEQQSDIADPTKDALKDLTMENSELFTKTKFPREAVHDGENMRLLAEGASKQVQMVSNGAAGVDIEDFFAEVSKHFRGGDNDGVNWARIGANYSMVYLSAPAGGGFMLGPLDKPAKGPRAQNKRRKLVDDDTEEVGPETMKAQKGNKTPKQTKDQTQTRIAEIKARVKRTGDTGVKKDMFETLLNPMSFTQSVENIFDFSFFVKNGEGAIDIDKETQLPQIAFKSEEESVQGTVVPAKQWLMSFTPADFRELKELYGLTESSFGHRDEGPKSDYYDPLVDGPRESNRQ